MAFALGPAGLALRADAAAFLGCRLSAGFPLLLDVPHECDGPSVAEPVSGVSLAIGQWIRLHDWPTTADLVPAFAAPGIRVVAARALW